MSEIIRPHSSIDRSIKKDLKNLGVLWPAALGTVVVVGGLSALATRNEELKNILDETNFYAIATVLFATLVVGIIATDRRVNSSLSEKVSAHEADFAESDMRSIN